jgi:hypothetical protein
MMMMMTSMMTMMMMMMITGLFKHVRVESFALHGHEQLSAADL